MKTLKKNLKIVLFSCLLGTLLATLFFLNIKEKAEAKNKNTLFVFQVGVFKNEQNAMNLSSQYPSARIIKDKDYYRVFIGATLTNKSLLKSYFDGLKYNYYVKEVDVSEEIIAKMSPFDELLRQAKEKNYAMIIKNTLENLPDVLSD